MKSIDLTNKCGSCCHFKSVDGTAIGECLLRPYGEDVVHDQNHPYQMVPRSKVKCTWHNEKPMTKTNADKIRAMTDEELAEWLCDSSDCYLGRCIAFGLCECNAGKANGMKKWLKQPAEDDC